MKDGEGEKERKEKKDRKKEKTLTHDENFRSYLATFRYTVPQNSVNYSQV